MDFNEAYLTIRYYKDLNGTKYKIVSDNRFKECYDFVQENLKNG